MKKIYQRVLAGVSQVYLPVRDILPFDLFTKLNCAIFSARFLFVLIFSSLWFLSQAQVVITAATGGTGISADKAVNAATPAFTSLGDIKIQETAAGDIATDVTQLVLNAPAGWQFNTSGVIASAGAGDITIGSITYTLNSITIPLTVASAVNIDLITISNLAVRATDGSVLPNSGNVTPGFTGSINNLTSSANFGSLSQAVGNASRLFFSTQPGSTTYGSVIGTSSIVTQDQFGNPSTTGLAANVTVTAAVASGTGTLTGTVTQNIGTSGGNGTVSFSNLFASAAGVKTISASAPGFTAATSSSFTINQAPLTVKASDQNKSYGATLTLGTTLFTTVGLVNGETIGAVTLSSTGAINTANAGSYPIIPSAATGGTFTAANYNITYTNGNLTVTKAVLTATADDNSKVYGAANPALTTSYSGFQNSDNAASLTTAPNASTTATTASPVGTYTISVGGGVSNNYTFSYVNGTLTVTKAALTVTADSKSKIYGAANPALTISYSGFQNSDNAASLTTAPNANTTATTASVVGTYPISASGAVSGNYTFIYVDGTLTVTKATPPVSVASAYNPACFGAPVKFKATITPGPADATGQVQFFDGGVLLGTVTVSGDTAVLSTSALTVGAHSITAKYLGDANYNTTTSIILSQQVNANPTGTLTATETSGVANNDNTICTGATVTFKATPGYALYTFYVDGIVAQSASPSSTFSSNTLNSGDMISVQVFSSLNCSAFFNTQTIIVNALPVPTLSANKTTICAGDNVIFTASGGTNYVFKINGSPVQNGASNTYNSTSLTDGASVTVDVTNANGCTATSATPVIIHVNSVPSGTLSASSTTICTGDNVTFTATAGFTSYEFKVNGATVSGPAASNTYNTTTLSNAQVVTVIAKNASGCSATFNPISVTVHALPTGTLTAAENSGTPNDNSICFGTNVRFTATAGLSNYDFQVNGSSKQNGSSNTYNNNSLSNGDVVSVVVKNGNNCVKTLNSITITVVPSPSGTLTASLNPVCKGDNVVFTATGGFTNYNFMVNGITVQNGSSNTYNSTSILNGDALTVNVTNSSGCVTTFGPVNMVVNNLPTGTLTIAETSGTTPNDGTICTGATVLFTAPAGFTNYDFLLNGASVQSGTGSTFTTSSLANGDKVSVQVKNGSNCIGLLNPVFTIAVKTLPPVQPIAGTLSVCVNDITSLTDATPGGVWNTLNPGIATVNTAGAVTGVSAGIATITYSVTNTTTGCDSMVKALVTVNALPAVAAIAGNVDVCTGNDTQLTDATAGGIWGTSDNTVATVSAAGLVHGVTGGSVTISYTVTNTTTGCIKKVTAAVNVHDLPVLAPITFNAPATSFDVCAGNNITLSDATTGGSWSSSATGIATINASSGVLTGVADGTTTISYSVTNANGCTTVKTQDVKVHALPVPSLNGPNPICDNSTDTYTTEPGHSPTYSWTYSGGTLISGGTPADNTITIKWDQPGVRTVHVNYQNSFGCSAATSANINTNTGTIPTLTGTNPVCLNSDGTYTTQPGFTNYTWAATNGTVTAGGSTNVSTVNWTTAGAGSVSVNFTDANGCVAADPTILPVTVHTLPLAAISGSTTICKGSPAPVVTFTGSNGTAPYTFNYTINGVVQPPVTTTVGNSATVTAPTGTAGVSTYQLVNVSDNNLCAQNQTGSVTITVDPASAGGTVNADATVCSGTNGGTLNLTGQTGNIVRWESSIDGTTWTSISNTTASLTYVNLTQTTLYRAVVQSGVCNTANSSPATITVSPVTVGGSAGASTSVCSGTNTGTINLAGQTGSVTRWESSTDGTTWTPIANTTTSLTYNNITQTTQYRAVVQSGVCGVVNSAAATITVNAVSAGGSVAANATVCSGSNNGILNLTGQTGTVVRWESSIDGTTWAPIANTTTSLTYNNITQTTQYRAVVQSGVCSAANSSAATITVNPATVGGSVGPAASVCAGANGGTLSLTGQTGVVVRWESSLDGTTWLPLANTTTSQTYTNLTQTTQYRAVVQSGVCLISNSTAATITVNNRPTGILSGTQGVCNGVSATLTITATGSGTINGTLSDGTPFSGMAPTITVTVSPTVNTTYTIATLSDANCTANAGDKTGSATVTQNGATPITLVQSSPANICLGSSANLFIPSGTSTIVAENFEGARIFTVVNTAPHTAGSEWTLRNSVYNLPYSCSTTAGVTTCSQTAAFNSGSHFMLTVSDNDNAAYSPTNTALVSPTVSTVGYTALSLQYRTYYKPYPPDLAVVEVSTNNGASWTIVQNVTSLGTLGSAANFSTQNIDLNSYINNATFQVRFRYTTNNGWWWAIDDINLTGVAAVSAPGNYSWTASPAATAGLPPGASTPSTANTSIIVTPTATGSIVYTAKLTNALGCISSKDVTVAVNAAPAVSITADYCAVPGKVKLTANATAGSSFLWSTGETTQSINVDIAAVYQVTATLGSGCPSTASISVAQELVVNGHFDAGNTGFTSPPLGVNQYQYRADVAGNNELVPEGLYGVGPDANTYHFNFWGHDHTTGSGNYMIVNGFPNGNPQPVAWQEVVNVLPGTTYYFSAWAMSLNNLGPFASLQFNVNGAQVGTIAVLGSGVSNNTNNGWTRFYGTITTGPTTTVAVISITDLQTALGGNDFGLDDISFGTLSTFIQLESAPGTDAQTTCVNTPLTDIVYSVGSTVSGPVITGLPPGLTTSFNGVLFTISGTPTAPGNYVYTVKTTGTCNPSTATGTITVPAQTISLTSSSSTPSVCENDPLTITYKLSGTATGATVTGLPTGVNSSVSGTTFTISGTPTAAGIYPFTITTSGTCNPTNVSGTITVNSQTITLNSGLPTTNQTLCINTPLTNIQYTIGGTGSGASVSGLPAGVTGSFNSGIFIISGTPTQPGIFNYTVTTSGASCSPVTATGSITVTPAASITLSSGTNLETACKGTAIGNITFTINDATGADAAGLPAGVTGTFSAGAFTISGTPTSGGIYNYTITTSGGCAPATASGTITVQEQTVTLTSGNASPSLCFNTNLSPNIVYTIGGTATSATVSGLPTGMTGVLTGKTVTISGTPTGTPGIYAYTVTTSGTCGQFTANGNITVLPAAIGGDLTSVSICSGDNGSLSLGGYSGNIIRWEYSTDGGGTWTPIANTSSVQAYPALVAARMYRAVVGNSCGNVFSSVATIGIHDLWTGAKGTDWNTPGNWSDSLVPSTTCPIVYIPNTPNKPILASGTATINNLQISTGASLTVTAAKLQIAGGITNDGVFDVSDGTIEFNGSAAQNIGAGVFKNNAIKNLVISNTAGVTLGGALDVYNSLTYGISDAKLATGGFLTLKSTAIGTASIGDMTNHTITGDVTVERFIGTGPYHAKSWQLLATPTEGQTIKASWQEGAMISNIAPPNPTPGSAGNPVAGYGTMLTSDLPNAVALGFDGYTQPGPSIKTYVSATDTYIGPTSTSNSIYDQKGYFVLVRGDRSVYLYNQAANPTILRTKGTLFTPANAPPSTTVLAGKFESVGNPYASALDLRNISKTTQDFFTVWDPKLGGTYGLGGFVTLSKSGSDYFATPQSPTYGSGPQDFIQSGQAFLVQAFGSDGTVSFKESDKTSGSSLVNRPMRDAGVQSQLRTNLYIGNADGGKSLADGTLIQYSDLYSNSIDGMDARKMHNTGENLGIQSAGKLLTVERRRPITQQDTIFLNLTGMSVQQYQFQFTADNINAAGLEGFLEDSYLHTRTPVSLSGSTVVNFTIENIAGSYAPDRFRIVFAPSVVLPVTFTSIKAYQQDKNINVEWRVENENNMKQYEVEKSINGTMFTTMAVKAATANGGRSAIYVTTDITPVVGYNYYRVKSVDVNGKTAYTSIVKVLMGSTKQDIVIVPNPITDGMIHLQLLNQPEGRYGLRLLNNLGQVIVSKQINHAEGSSTELIKWDFNLAHGIYKLEVTKPDGSVKDINVLY